MHLTRLILIRHGESVHGVEKYISDLGSCKGLTDHGLAQARQLSERLQASAALGRPDAIITSPVQRARQTAEALAFPGEHAAVHEDHGLREINPGEADGMPLHMFRERFEFDLPTEPDRPFAPGGESWNQFKGRVQNTLTGLAQTHPGKTVYIVTHGGFIVLSLVTLFSIPRPGTGAYVSPGHTSLTIWDFDGENWQLERFNDLAHLQR